MIVHPLSETSWEMSPLSGDSMADPMVDPRQKVKDLLAASSLESRIIGLVRARVGYVYRCKALITVR